MVTDAQGNLYLCFATGLEQPDPTHPDLLPPDYRIRKIDAATGIITTVVGTGNAGKNGIKGDGGPALAAPISPFSIAFDGNGNLFFSEFYFRNGALISDVRKVDAKTGILSTAARVGSRLEIDLAGNLYVGLSRIDSTGKVTLLAGNGQQGFSGDGGPATEASLSSFVTTALDANGNFYFSDYSNARIRRVSFSSAKLTFLNPTVAGNADTIDNPLKVMFSNIGNAPLTFGSNNPELNSADFALDSSTTCPSSSMLASGSSCQLAVNFQPTTAGNLAGNLVLKNDSGNIAGNQQTVMLAGVGLPATVHSTQTKVSSISPSETIIGKAVTVTATVVDSKDSTKPPTGTVDFTIGRQAIGSAVVTNGAATLRYVPAAPYGTFLITAFYKSDDNAQFGNSFDTVGQPLIVYADFVVQAVGTNINITQGTITASRHGAPAYFDLNVSPSGTLYPGEVSFTISGLPPGASATFSPGKLAQDAGRQTVRATIQLTGNQAANQRPIPFLPGGKVPLAAGCILLACGVASRKRKSVTPLLMLGILAMLTMLNGCMQGTVPSGVTSYNVVITAAGGAARHEVPIQLRLTD
jgi:hypothetical protein